MLKTQFIRDNRDRVIDSLKIRNWKEEKLDIINSVISLDDKRKSTQTSLDDYLSQINAKSKEIGDLYKRGEQEHAEALKQDVAKLKENSDALRNEMTEIKNGLEEYLLQIPNVAHETVPPGNSDADNEVYRECQTEISELTESKMPHWELAEKYDILDMALGAKLTGSGFPLFKGKGARLQRALISFLLDEVTSQGYLEILPPLMVNADSARATGQLPDKEGQMYHVQADNLYLIPTAEVPITNLYRDVIVKEENLPIKLTGHTPCFRREAGSYGADVKGLNRVHQFDKVEIVQIVHPDRSYDTLTEMMDTVGPLLDKLELPYRILRLCGGDLGFTSVLTYDFEVYSLAQKKWLEVSSVSNFETFQTNRLKCRFKDKDGKTRLTHSLNGSAFGLARIMAAVLENNQTSNGIVIPDVLRKYTGFEIID